MDELSSGETYDVCVVGAGPAGSTAATFIAMRGHRVLLLERETLPIYKVGESLLPATIHGICEMLGVGAEVRAQGFVRKLGGTFRWGKNKDPWTFAFAESSRFQGPTSYAYQVERIKFDSILVNNARRHGVEVREGHQVQEVLVNRGRISAVKTLDNKGVRALVKCRYVVDASGHTSTICRYAGQRIFSNLFKNIAVFGYFKNGGRLPAPNAGNIFCVAFAKGWFWYIPLSDELTSVGAVIGEEYGPILRKGHEVALRELIASCQPIADLLSHATRFTEPPYDEVRVRKDYSYCHSSFWKPGLVLVGDAACFIDPVFSSGVHLATYSALLAARSINTCLANRLDEETVFEEFQGRYRREYQCFYEFLTAFYDLEQDLDGYYWSARDILNEQSGGDAFLRLVGGDASNELGLARDRRIDSSTLFPSATGMSSDMYVETGHYSEDRKQFWNRLNAEGFQLQLRGALGTSTPAEEPLFRQGLTASADGLDWVARSHT